MAVGQVDVLVGVPTLNNAATVGGVVGAVHRAFATHFKRQRTVLINSDAGSTDGTPEIVRSASLVDAETLIAPQSLRTLHRVSVPYHGLPGKAGALQTLFAAAELLQARAVAFFDADVTSIEPDWVARLVRPVHQEAYDFVAPIYARHAFDGLLVTQLARPLLSGAYGHRLQEPVASEFACSGRFASHCLAQPIWDDPLSRFGIDPWLTTEALARGFRCGQAFLGPRVQVTSEPRPTLPDLFRQVVGSLFACLEKHASYWLERRGSEAVAILTPGPQPAEPAPAPDAAPLIESFRAGVRDLAPVLEQALRRDTLARLTEIARDETHPRYTDELWAATVYEFAAAHHRSVMHREHLSQAMVPLYLGRTAHFVLEEASGDPAVHGQALEALGRAYDAAKPYLVELWTGRH